MEFKSKRHRESPRGHKMCDTILPALLYALRDYPDLLKIVREMSNGTSNSALGQKLQDISTLGIAHKDLLEQINFDMSLPAGARKRL
jgi:hypothetical protein